MIVVVAIDFAVVVADVWARIHENSLHKDCEILLLLLLSWLLLLLLLLLRFIVVEQSVEQQVPSKTSCCLRLRLRNYDVCT